jgi:hypothetical protein
MGLERTKKTTLKLLFLVLEIISLSMPKYSKIVYEGHS